MMTWIYFVFAFICGTMAGFLYGHFRGLHELREYDIDEAIRRAREVGYWTRAMEEIDD